MLTLPARSPNDVVVKSDGSIWFSDPPYGILSNHEGYQAESEVGANLVYRFDPTTRSLTVATRAMDKPNGLAFSLDENYLFVSDTAGSHDAKGAHHIKRFRINATGTACEEGAGEVFAVIDPGLPDGFRLDERGCIWTSAGDGVHCYHPDGTLLGKILVPERAVSNVVFGGADGRRLFITATASLYSVELAVRGGTSAQPRAAPERALAIIDPHFHAWSLVSRPNANLGDMRSKLPEYLVSVRYSVL